jgi:hypothetical protein
VSTSPKIYEKGNSSVPPSNARGIPKREIPTSTIFADEAILLTIRTATKKDEIICRYLNEEG